MTGLGGGKSRMLETPEELGSWAELVREVKLPLDISAAVSTGRSQLLALAARDMNKEEVVMVLNLVGVLIDTNRALQSHSAELADLLKQIKGNVKGLHGSVDKALLVADFKNPERQDED